LRAVVVVAAFVLSKHSDFDADAMFEVRFLGFSIVFIRLSTLCVSVSMCVCVWGEHTTSDWRECSVLTETGQQRYKNWQNK